MIKRVFFLFTLGLNMSCLPPSMENTVTINFDLSDTLLTPWSQKSKKTQTISFPFGYRALNITLTTSNKKSYILKGDSSYIQDWTVQFDPISEEPPYILSGQFVTTEGYVDEFQLQHDFPANHVIEFKARITKPLTGQEALVIKDNQFAYKDLHICGTVEETRSFCALK